MVFYIEACESGSMMENLPENINGKVARNITLKKGSNCSTSIPNTYVVNFLS